jgi:TP901 family phage tail tape measure protein
MKRIASNRSELIKIPGAIEKVADSAALLASASGLTFKKSGEVITQVMNQYKMGLESTDKITNTFAAAAKLGSFEIDRLAQSFSRAGGAMVSMGASFEQSMGLVMIGSRLGLTGEMVGTQLKTGILRLGQQDDLFNPIKVGFTKAMDNLRDARLSPKEMMSIFGLESYQVMQAVMENSDLWKQWTSEITDTNLANIQAAIQLDTMKVKMKKLVSEYKKIERKWFFSPKTQKMMYDTLDKLDEFLSQWTVGS